VNEKRLKELKYRAANRGYDERSMERMTRDGVRPHPELSTMISISVTELQQLLECYEKVNEDE
jgi:hypothetical protein